MKGDKAIADYVAAMRALKATDPTDEYAMAQAKKAARAAIGNLNGGELSRARRILTAEGIQG